jgi:hypothetical protein
MPAQEFEDVLGFWFPKHLVSGHAAMVTQFQWWFRGGADTGIVERFAGLLERAAPAGCSRPTRQRPACSYL